MLKRTSTFKEYLPIGAIRDNTTYGGVACAHETKWRGRGNGKHTDGPKYEHPEELIKTNRTVNVQTNIANNFSKLLLKRKQ